MDLIRLRQATAYTRPIKDGHLTIPAFARTGSRTLNKMCAHVNEARYIVKKEAPSSQKRAAIGKLHSLTFLLGKDIII